MKKKSLKKLFGLFLGVILGIGVTAGVSTSGKTNEVVATDSTVTLTTNELSGTQSPISWSSGQGGAGTKPGLYNDGIRLYQGAPGGYIELTAANGYLITGFSASNTGTYNSTAKYLAVDNKPSGNPSSDGAGTSVAKNGQYTVSGLSGSKYVYIICYGGDKNSRLEISQIVVSYKTEGQVVQKNLTSLQVSGAPTKTSYSVGENFDPAGLTVTGTYDDESTGAITSGIDWTCTPSTIASDTTSVVVVAKVGQIESDPYTVNGLSIKVVPTKPTDCTEITDHTSFNSKMYSDDDEQPTTNNGYKGGTGSTPAFTYALNKVPAGANKLVIYAAAWNGTTSTLTLDQHTGSITINGDAGMSSNSPFKLTKAIWDSSYRYDIDVSGITEESTITLNFSSRAAIWYAGYVADSRVLESISIEDKTYEYYLGQDFVMPTVTAHFAGTAVTEDVTAKATQTGFDNTTVVDSASATISYTHNNVTKTCSYTYKIREYTVTSIRLDKNSKVYGYAGKTYDFSKVVVLGTYEDDDEEVPITGCSISTTAPNPTERGEFDIEVTAKYGQLEDAVDTLTAFIKNDGLTQEYPLNTTEMVELIDDQYSTSTSVTEYYAHGTVKSFYINKSGVKQGIYLEDPKNKSVEVYQYVNPSNFVIEIGNEVLVKGKLKLYGSTYELDAGCEILACWDPAKVPSKIDLSNLKTSYHQGETLDMPTVTATISSGTEDVTALAECEDFDTTTVGEHTVDVTYTVGLTTVSASYTYTVVENKLKSIEITGGKVTGVANVGFDYSEVIVIGHYDVGDYPVDAEFSTDEEIPTSRCKDFHMTVTAEFDGKSDDKEFNATIRNSGLSINDPLNIEESMALIDENKQGSTEYYVEGIAETDPYDKSGNPCFDFTDGTNSMQAFKFSYDSSLGEKKIEIGDHIIVKGKIKLYGTTYELESGCVVVSIVAPVYALEYVFVGENPKLTYYLGEDFDATGLVVMGHFENDKNKELTVDVDYTVDYSLFNKFEVGTYDILILVNDDVKDAEGNTLKLEAEVIAKEDFTTGYRQVTSADELTAGSRIILGSKTDKVTKANGGFNKSYLNAVDATIEDGFLTSSDAEELVVGISGDNYSLKLGDKYLVKNSGDLGLSDTESFDWTITASSTGAVIADKTNASNKLQYNASSPRFKTYTSPQTEIMIFKYVEEQPEVLKITAEYTGSKALYEGQTLDISDFTINAFTNDGNSKKLTSGVTLDGTGVLTLGSNVLKFVYDMGTPDESDDLETTLPVTARAKVSPTSISVSLAEGSSDKVFEGSQVQLLAGILPADTDDKTITWSSSNTDLATVDDNGLVTTKDVGNDGVQVTITATSNDDESVYGSIVITIDNDDVKSIVVKTNPNKTTYDDFENFDATGLVITATYDSGKTVDVTYDGTNMIFDKQQLRTTDEEVTVTYEGQEATIALSVQKVLTATEIKTIDGIDNLYTDDTEVEVEVTMLKVYSDDSSDEEKIKVTLTDFTVGENEFEFTYEGNEYSFFYDVTQAVVTGIEVKTSSTKTVYYEGDNFDKTGLVITATYNSGKQADVQAEDVEILNGTAMTGHQPSVTISYAGCITTQDVLVEIETDVKSIYIDGSYDKSALLDEEYVFNGKIMASYESGARDITEQVKDTIKANADTSSLGDKTYTLTWNGKSVVINYTVVNALPTGVVVNSPFTGAKYIGEEFDLTATVLPANANQKVTWSSSDEQIATVDENGHVVVVGAGEVTIVATTINEIRDSFVFVGVKHVEDVTLDKDTIYLGVGEHNTYTLNPTVLPEDAYDKTVTYTSSNPTVASVDENGVITALGYGKTTITATSDGVSTTCQVIVEGDNDVLSIQVDGSYTNSATLDTPYAFDGKITATFNYGTIDITDKVVDQINALDTSSIGNKTLTVRWNGKSVELSFNVSYAKVQSVTISGQQTGIVLVGNTFKLNASVLPANANQQITWMTNSSNITIDANGNVFVLGAGKIIIYAVADGNVYDTYQFVAYAPVSSVSLGTDVVHMANISGLDTYTLNISINPSDAYYESVSITSSDEDIVSIDGLELVLEGKTGEAIITVSVDGKVATLKVIVEDVRQPLSVYTTAYTDEVIMGEQFVFDGKVIATYQFGSVNVTEMIKSSLENAFDTTKLGRQYVLLDIFGKRVEFSINVVRPELTSIVITSNAPTTIYDGDTFVVTSTSFPEYARNDVTWKSSNSAVARVDENGNVTVLKAGSFEIWAVIGDVESNHLSFKANKTPVLATGVTLNKESLEMTSGDIVKVTATIDPENVTETTLTWTSSDENVATVDANGRISAHQAGEATITVSINGHEATLTVKVSAPSRALLGCEGSLIGTSAIISMVSLLGLALVANKKRKED